MSMQSMEREIMAEARVVLKRPKLRVQDLQEWSTSEADVRDNAREDIEVVVYLPGMKAWAAFLKEATS